MVGCIKVAVKYWKNGYGTVRLGLYMARLVGS